MTGTAPPAGAGPAYDAEDALKHIGAQLARYVRVLVWARDNLHSVEPDVRFEDLVISGAQDIQRAMHEHLAAHGATGDRYATGMPVTSHVELRAGEAWQWCWHPDPAHPHNRPRHISAAELPDGRRGDVVVTAPGVLDLVPAAPNDEGGC